MQEKRNIAGISLISLIITIIVIIILAAIVLFSGLGVPDSANFAKYTQQVDNFQTAVQEEYATRTTKYSMNNQTRTDAQVYYTIATGNEVDVNTKTEDLRVGTVEELGLELKPTGLDGNEYFEVTPNTTIAGKKDNKGLYQSLGTFEKHYITDRGEFFVLPGYRYYGSDGKTKWYVTAGKYYESEEGITGPLNMQISDVSITKDLAGTQEVDGTLEKGKDKAYIHFSVNIEGGTAEISPAVPYEITDNGEYTFTITANVDGMAKTTTKKVNIVDTFIQITPANAFTYKVESSTVKITGLTDFGKTLQELNIPSKISSWPVTCIWENAFKNGTNITSITVPSSVTNIARSAFEGCSNLTNITIPSSVTSIGKYAFYRCTSLTNIDIPSGVTIIDDGTFTGCTGLENLNNLPENITRIGDGVFSGCSNLKSITIPSKVTTMGSYVFRGCSSLKSIVLPEGLTNIESGSFQDCTSLTSISIPDSAVNWGGYYIFQNCKSLTSITIPNGVTEIGMQVFYDCHSLTNVSIPSTVTNIGTYAFSNCKSLESIVIPEGTTSINGQFVFSSSPNLKKIRLPVSLTQIGKDAFYHSSIQEVYYKGTEEQWNQITMGSNNYTLTNATKYFESTGSTTP